MKYPHPSSMAVTLILGIIALTGLASPPNDSVPAASTRQPGRLPEGAASDRAPARAVVLWNGRDLSGWRAMCTNADVNVAGVWSVTNGALQLAGKPLGYLQTENTFSNYHLHVEWRWLPGASTNSNSGVFIHLNGPVALWPRSVECQLKNGAAGEMIGHGGVDFLAPLISGKKRAKIKSSSERPLGEWNAYDISCRGDSIETIVNGVHQQRIERVTVSSGSIGLQLEGYPVQFRNIWLSPLVNE